MKTQHMTERGLIGKSVILLLVLFLAAGGALAYLLTRNSGEDPGASPEASDSPVVERSPIAEAGWGTEYIKLDRETGSGDSKRAILQVYFVNDEFVRFPLAQQANKCVRSYLKEGYDSVSCYAFPTLEALEFAGVDEESGGMEKLCWTAFASRSAAGDKTIQVEEGQYRGQGCPA